MILANQMQIVNTNNLMNNIPAPASSNSSTSASSSSTTSSSSINSIQANKLNTNNNNFQQLPPQPPVMSSQPNPQSIQSSNMNNTTTLMQRQNYITWINSHLKKRPGVKLVENLESDLSNGVCLIHLIEVISGTVLTDVNLNPKTFIDSKENIEKILKFMQANSIKMHQTTSKEIIEGQLKPIMRLILALAAHFKPTNVQPYSTVMSRTNNTTNGSGSASTTTTANLNAVTSSSSMNKQNLVLNKRSHSSHANQIDYENKSNFTYVVEPNQNAKSASKAVPNQTRNLDSMTHLVQAACVSLADVRRYKNENFNVKYVKRNSLNSPNQMRPDSNYLNPINTNKPSTNQTYLLNKIQQNSSPSSACNQVNHANEHNIMPNMSISSSFMSPSCAQPLASSTVLMPNNRNEIKSCKNLTFVLNKSKQDEIINKQNAISNENSTNQNEINKNENSNSQSSSLNKTVIIDKEQSAIKENYPQDMHDNQDNQNKDPIQDELQRQLEDIEMLNDVQSLKAVLLNLQTLLMRENIKEFTDTDSAKETSQESGCQSASENNFDANTSNNSGSGCDEGFPLANLSKDEQIAILRSKIQQFEILCADLRNELNQTKADALNKNGLHSGLKHRLTEQDNTILEMKNEHINLHLYNQQLVQSKEDLSVKLDEGLKQISLLKNDLSKKDELIEKMRLEINDLLLEKEQAKYMRQQVKQVTDTLEIVQEKEQALSEMIASTDRKLILIDDKLAAESTQKRNQIISQDEANSLKESLIKLRQMNHANQPSNYLINNLENAFANIIERSNTLYLNLNQNQHTGSTSSHSSSISSNSSSSANSPVVQMQSQSPSSTSSMHSSTGSEKEMKLNGNSQGYDSSDKYGEQILIKHESYGIKQEPVALPLVNNEGNVKKIISRFLSQAPVNNGSKTNFPNQTNQRSLNNLHYTNSNNQPVRNQEMTSTVTTLLTISSNNSKQTNQYDVNSSLPSTKCVYYLKDNATPYMTTIFKSIGAITLGDFKECIKLKSMNSYRFHFKSQDPEFGVVKEEISNDKKLLPSFENRIIAWIQELD